MQININIKVHLSMIRVLSRDQEVDVLNVSLWQYSFLKNELLKTKVWLESVTRTENTDENKNDQKEKDKRK